MSRKIEGQNFASLLSPRKRFISNPGSTEANDYQIIIDKKGHKSLKLVGTHDIYQEIQSYHEETKIENIIARAAAGDAAAMNARQGFYADITNSPKDLAEAQNHILKLSQEFDKLPAEIRAKFDNSKSVFVNEFGNDEWYKKMGFKTESVSNETKETEFIPGTKETAQPLTPEE